jgi:hypothetical protein
VKKDAREKGFFIVLYQIPTIIIDKFSKAPTNRTAKVKVGICRFRQSLSFSFPKKRAH